MPIAQKAEKIQFFFLQRVFFTILSNPREQLINFNFFFILSSEWIVGERKRKQRSV